MLTSSGALNIHSNQTIYFSPVIHNYFGGSKNMCVSPPSLSEISLHVSHFLSYHSCSISTITQRWYQNIPLGHLLSTYWHSSQPMDNTCESFKARYKQTFNFHTMNRSVVFLFYIAKLVEYQAQIFHFHSTLKNFE